MIWPNQGKRKCLKCGKFKKLIEFHRHRDCFMGRNTICKTCRKPISFAQQKARAPELKMYSAARQRAKNKGWRFNIELSDVVIPKLCPVFGVPLVYGTKHAPSIDRIDSKKGYVKGNVRVISKRANLLKSDGTVAEFEMILSDGRRLL